MPATTKKEEENYTEHNKQNEGKLRVIEKRKDWANFAMFDNVLWSKHNGCVLSSNVYDDANIIYIKMTVYQ